MSKSLFSLNLKASHAGAFRLMKRASHSLACEYHVEGQNQPQRKGGIGHCLFFRRDYPNLRPRPDSQDKLAKQAS